MRESFHHLANKIMLRSYTSIWIGLDWIFPPSCIGCNKQGIRICTDCLNLLNYTGISVCTICGQKTKQPALCTKCKRSRPDFTKMRSVFTYSGLIREAIHKLKYENDLGLAEVLSHYLFDFINQIGWKVNLIVPVPLNQARLRERGFNQAALLSLPLALRLDVKYKPNAISRIRNTRSQVGLNVVERYQNVDNAFVADRKILEFRDILIIDDVTTTGATLNAVAKAAKTAGARKIFCLTLARAQHLTDHLQ